MPDDPSTPIPAAQPAVAVITAPSAPSVVATPELSPAVHLAKVEFSDGTSFTLGSNDIVVLVGPNNAGKSQALRDVRGLAQNPRGFPSVVIKKVELSLTGSCSDLVRFIEARGKREENSSNYLYHINGSQQECPELTRHPKTS